MSEVGEFLGAAGLVIVWRGVTQHLDSLDRRRSLVETRTGTVLLVPGAGGPLAQVLARPQLLGPAPAGDDGDEFDASEIESTHTELIRVNERGRMRMIERDDPPPDPLAETNRRLTLRLLRDAIEQAGAESNRLPGFRELGWSSETWTRAVCLLKPHVTTKQGRGGGTFCY